MNRADETSPSPFDDNAGQVKRGRQRVSVHASDLNLAKTVSDESYLQLLLGFSIVG